MFSLETLDTQITRWASARRNLMSLLMMLCPIVPKPSREWSVKTTRYPSARADKMHCRGDRQGGSPVKLSSGQQHVRTTEKGSLKSWSRCPALARDAQCRAAATCLCTYCTLLHLPQEPLSRRPGGSGSRLLALSWRCPCERRASSLVHRRRSGRCTANMGCSARYVCP